MFERSTQKFRKFSPADGGSGPTVLMASDWGAEVKYTAAMLCHVLGATVMVLDPLVAAIKHATWGHMADLLLEFIETHCDGSVDCVVGWCAPSEACARAAVSNPTAIKSLVLNSLPAIPKDDTLFAHTIQPMFDLMDEHGLEQGIHMFLQAITSPELLMFERGKQTYNYSVETLSSMFGSAKDAEERRSYFAAVWNTPMFNRYSDLLQPALILGGTDDALFASGVENLSCLVPNSQLQRKHGAGHLPHIEAPRWYFTHVLSFLVNTVGIEVRDSRAFELIMTSNNHY